MEDRLRNLLTYLPVTEKKMFGGLCFMYQGNMLCGVTNKGQLMMRMGKELEAKGRELPGASDMNYTGRKMGGMLFVDPDAVEEDAVLQPWIDLCVEFAKTLPPK